MKIYGGKDYYDVCIGLGAYDSDDVVFVRNKSVPQEIYGPRFVSLNNLFSTKNYTYDYWPYGNTFTQTQRTNSLFRRRNVIFERIHRMHLLFCGKAYVGYEIHDFGKEKQYAWTKEKFVSILKKKTSDDDFKDIRFSIGHLPEQNDYARETLEEKNASIILTVENSTKRHDHVYTDAAVLSTFGVQQLLDPYVAYQELSMWLNTRASPEKPMIKVSNEILIKKHGFDKYSFRNEKRK